MCIAIFFRYNSIFLKSGLIIARLVEIFCIFQVFLYRFLLAFFLCFLTQTMVSYTLHKLPLFVLRAIELKAIHGIFLIAEIHSLDLSPQTVPIHTASRRLKPFFNRFCLDGIRDFHLLPIHTDRLQFIRKTYFHLNFAHDNLLLPVYLVIVDVASVSVVLELSAHFYFPVQQLFDTTLLPPYHFAAHPCQTHSTSLLYAVPVSIPVLPPAM